ncbi:4-diphosphocytidyl-2-C-methyl-D-erythritol kinase [Spirochaetia bacterium]|nr:4-diphosphocytidyl-2-C-methyl-D-erythritol kinase [Spirochaetia bacterium]
MSKMLKIRAPCKINLHLRIGDRRADGYHDLKSIFAALDFGDALGFELFGDNGFCDILTDRKVPGMSEFPVPIEKNIVYKAVSLYRSRTGFNRGLRIHLEKRIPLGGGLGGGSSDAASTLMALNALAGEALSPLELKELAEQLGSDVPFFLTGGAAWVSGRGEYIEPLPLPGKLQAKSPGDIAVVLVNPGFPSGTAEAFRQMDLWREQGGTETAPGSVSDDTLKRALGGHPRDWSYENDFLPVFLAGKEAKTYGDIISCLKTLGADFSGLSGAGSTCFGIFTDGGSAEKAEKILLKRWKFVELTFFLARSAVTVLE